MSDIDRFNANYEPVTESGCWIWTGGARRSGKEHGRFWHNGRHVFAYRWSYEHFHGPIPEGCRIYHLCDVQECVNPDHLQIAEPLDNSMDAIVERIKSRCIPITESGCFIWQGATTKGYGQVSIGGKLFYTHRIIYEHFRGPIPSDLCLDHLCRVTVCVNVDHLEPVTNLENLARGRKFRRAERSL